MALIFVLRHRTSTQHSHPNAGIIKSHVDRSSCCSVIQMRNSHCFCVIYVRMITTILNISNIYSFACLTCFLYTNGESIIA